ncbi:MAG: CsgG/HfaB family protein [Treponema sp.]|jgi:hypothetical protein|nr:CsgG/HfaB family protein [Treponema sp.]
MKQKFVFLAGALFVLGAAFVFGDTQLQIERLTSKVNSGFRERIYIDGKNVLTLANGKSGTVTVSDGPHRIYAELYTMKSDEMAFNAAGGIITISIAANSLDDFIISIAGASTAGAPASSAASAASAAASAALSAIPKTPAGQSTLESALYAAAGVIIARIQPRTTIAVVSVASRDTESADFVVDELAYIIVSSGNFKVVDRKSLDAIRSEQNFQTSGDVDDDSAVSIGKLLGANIVITGSISGAGSTRRLRLKALDVMTAEIVAMASEAY